MHIDIPVTHIVTSCLGREGIAFPGDVSSLAALVTRPGVLVTLVWTVACNVARSLTMVASLLI